MTNRSTPCKIVALAVALGAVTAHAATWEVAEGTISGRYPGYGAKYYGLPSMILMGLVGMLIATSLVGLPSRIRQAVLGLAGILALAALGFQIASFFAFGAQQATLTLGDVVVEGVGRLKGSQSQSVSYHTRAGWGLYLAAVTTAICVVLIAFGLRPARSAAEPPYGLSNLNESKADGPSVVD